MQDIKTKSQIEDNSQSSYLDNAKEGGIEFTQSIKRSGQKQFIAYFFVSAISLLVNLISRYFISFHINFHTSVVIAYILGYIVNFSLSSIFVFSSNTGNFTTQESKNSNHLKSSLRYKSSAKVLSLGLMFLRFSLVASISLLVALIVSVSALHILQAYLPYFIFILDSNPYFAKHAQLLSNAELIEFIAHIIGVIFSFICNFFGHKYFTFSKY
ncbi:GtrA family protein [Helicobacter muridarum]|uniref:GtrA-like protein n=1 Tax=Helicobacter muridarum TaxID=216 RepID=A0A377PTA6_9HELI|nr:hypothetical protein [Helicobacter muridarum]STQ85857.1 GtrA-like protein [Helicobacter muridarum]